MANPAPTINQINAFNATQGTTIDFNIIGGTELVRSNKIYIYDLSDNSLICTHLYVSTESIHELPPNTDGSIVYESGKSSADFVNGAQYYAQIQTYTDTAGTQGGSGLSVAKMFWCLDDPTLTIDTIPSTISTTSYNVSTTYNANTSVVSNIIQQYQFSLYSATGSLLQSSGVVVGNGEQQGTSTIYDISYNFTGLNVGSSYYVTVDVTTTQGMSISAQSSTFTVSIDTPTLGEATVVNNACDGYISVTSNLSSEYGGSGSGEIVSFETDSENVFTKLQVTLSPTQSGSGTPSPSNVRPIYGVGGVDVNNTGINIWDEEWVNGYYKQTDGTFVSASNFVACKNLIPITPNTKYWFSANVTHQVLWYNKEKQFISAVASQIQSTEYTSPNNAYYMAFYVGGTYGGTYNHDISINYPSTDHDYHAYQGQTISQEFDVSLTPTSKDTDPYLFKAVGDIYGDRLEEELVGGSVVWNQIIKHPDFSQGITGWSSYNATITAADNGCKITATSSWGNVYTLNAEDPQYVSGHKYLAHIVAKGENGGEYIGLNNNNGVNAKIADLTKTKTSYSIIFSAVNTGTFKYSIMTNTSGNILYVYEVRLIDITQLFGNATIADAIYAMEQATAGSGVAFMRKYFPKLFTADYDTGTIKSVEATAHVTRGVNAWDEEWELGDLNTSNGQNYPATNRIRSKNYIRVLPNTTYYFKSPYNSIVCFYDANKNFVNIGNATLTANATFTTKSNVHYMRISPSASYGTTYKNDICINISNPTINGKYFPYEEHTYDLGNVVLRGNFDLVDGELKAVGDIYQYDGTVTRKKVHLPQGTTYALVNTSSTGYKTYSYNTVNARVRVKTYPTTNFGLKGVPSFSSATVNEECIQLTLSNNQYIYFAIAPTRDIADFVMEYELATPTTEQTDPFTQIQKVSKYGTLEYITNNGIPVGHDTTYYTRDVFGGTLDLVSGRLVVDRVYADLGTLTWSEEIDGVYSTGALVGQIKEPLTNIEVPNILCSQYVPASYVELWSEQLNGSITVIWSASGIHGKIWVRDSRFTDAQSFKTAMNGVQLVYELATPLTYQLTPQQINTLVGVNNVWSEDGDIELSYHIPITNLLVKRQDVDDVSGNWLTLYSQPVEQASDMDFTFIDFLNQYGKTYKYALMPLLTQTQSGVEVEVEGGYTVSDEVQSIFDGVFIADATELQKCKANVGYGDVDMNQAVGTITPIGAKYPVVITNSKNQYHNGSITGTIVPDDYYFNGNLSRIDMVNKRNELEQFLTNKRAKIIKDWNSNIWLVMIMDNVTCTFNNEYGMGIVNFNANWIEVGDPTNQQDLQATGLIDVGGV